MRSQNSGRVVIYLDRAGKKQKAIARNNDQKEQWALQKKTYVRLINDDFTPMLIDGKDRCALVNTADLSVIGMVD